MSLGWSRRKLLKYIRSNDVSKLKHFIRKHKIEVNHERFENYKNNTLLHLACENGSDVVARFLLKSGASLLAQNDLGQVPLHLACCCALQGHRHAMDDLVSPLSLECPASLDIEDVCGVTPRTLVSCIRHQSGQRHSGCSENTEDLSTVDSDDHDQSEEEEENWNKKIAEEMSFELDESFRFDFAYTDDDCAYETYDQWADRIARQHAAKQFRSVPADRKRSRPSENPACDIPRIAEEKRRRFEKNEEIRLDAERKDRERQELIHSKRAKMNYERLCDQLFKKESSVDTEKCPDSSRDCKDGTDLSSNSNLGFGDIPWPCAVGDDLQTLEKFLFGDLDRTSPEYKSYLKRQQVRWHPDRFLQRCGHRLIPAQKERILKRVVAVCQILNGISQSNT